MATPSLLASSDAVVNSFSLSVTTLRPTSPAAATATSLKPFDIPLLDLLVFLASLLYFLTDLVNLSKPLSSGFISLSSLSNCLADTLAWSPVLSKVVSSPLVDSVRDFMSFCKPNIFFDMRDNEAFKEASSNPTLSIISSINLTDII